MIIEILAIVAEPLLTGATFGGIYIGYNVARSVYRSRQEKNGNGRYERTCDGCPVIRRVEARAEDTRKILESNHRKTKAIDHSMTEIKEGLRDLLEILRLELQMRKRDHEAVMTQLNKTQGV